VDRQEKFFEARRKETERGKSDRLCFVVVKKKKPDLFFDQYRGDKSRTIENSFETATTTSGWRERRSSCFRACREGRGKDVRKALSLAGSSRQLIQKMTGRKLGYRSGANMEE